VTRRIAILTSDLQYAAANKHEARRAAVGRFLPGLVRFLQFARQHKVPVIHLQLVAPPGDPRGASLPDELRFERGSRGVRMLEEVLAPSDVVIEKPKDSGFFQTNLDSVLKEMEIETTILTGMQAQICIQTTAADAFFRGYNVVVPSDGVVSTVEEDMKRALDWMGSYCAAIMTTAQVEAELAKESPSFPQRGAHG
jgi:nicotinamidase-related amidase